MLSERRVIAPHGMNGGDDGERGVNLWVRQVKDQNGDVVAGAEKVVNLGGRATVDVEAGDRVVILTPGGGGYGKKPVGGATAGVGGGVGKKKVNKKFKFTGNGSVALRSQIQLEQ
ncbi:unnamed protein product [Ambrosiozyma monospora]|uniref:Unnamed protein product n=1 Tax=Ambrosiozyma monospora TaxID=43982 RepID=A0ACB5U4C8_AMBMO|nr:unnamed protein product [Ambrosiozyma monospora]